MEGAKAFVIGGLSGDELLQYGNWYGKGWWGGDSRPDKPGHRAPVDALDAVAMRHDFAYMIAERYGKIFGLNEEQRLKSLADSMALRDASALPEDPYKWEPPAADRLKARRFRDKMITLLAYGAKGRHGLAGTEHAAGWVWAPIQSWELDTSNKLDPADLEHQVATWCRDWLRKHPESPALAASPTGRGPTSPLPSPSAAVTRPRESPGPTGAAPPRSSRPEPPRESVGTSVSVAVRDRTDDRPLEGVKVRATVAGHEPVVGVTDADGQWGSPIPAGDFVRLRLHKPGYGLLDVSRALDSGVARAALTMATLAGAQIHLVLRDRSTQQPIEGARVAAGGASGRTGPDGAVTLDVTPEEVVTLTAKASGYVMRRAAGSATSGEVRSLGWYLIPLSDVPEDTLRFEGVLPTSPEDSSKGMTGEILIGVSLDPSEGGVEVKMSGRGSFVGMKGPARITLFDRKGQPLRVKEVADATKTGTLTLGPASFTGAYDPTTGSLSMKGSMRGQMFARKVRWNGKDYEGPREGTPFPAPVRVRGSIRSGTGHLDVDSGHGTPDHFRVEPGRLIHEKE